MGKGFHCHVSVLEGTGTGLQEERDQMSKIFHFQSTETGTPNLSMVQLMV